MGEVWLGDIRLRNRLVTSSSLLGSGAPDSGLVPYGMSPISRFVPLERFGAVTTRTLTVAPRDGQFTNRTRDTLLTAGFKNWRGTSRIIRPWSRG